MLDSCARVSWDQRGRIGSYLACGCVGYTAGAVLASLLSWYGGVERAVVLAAVLTAPAGLFVGIKLMHIVTGRERIVFYEQLLLCMGAVWLVLRALGLPAGRGVDLITLGIGAFLGFGRIGCLMVGCCHGRPWHRGILYGEAHRRLGLPDHRVGQRLFPLQLVDAIVSWTITAGASWWFLHGAPPGAPAVFFLTLYGPARFVEEQFRGDAARPFWRGLSEAQWTALAVAWVLALALREPALIGAALLLTALAAPRFGRAPLDGAWHIDELHRALAKLELESAGDVLVETSLGLRLSLRRLQAPDGGGVLDYLMSRPARPLSETAVQPLVRRLGLPAAEVRAGATPGLIHLLLPDQRR